jgi:predicted dehydrogenase
MGSNHARILSSLPGVDFVGICDETESIVSPLAGVPLVNEIEELISMNINYAVVSVPTSSHFSVGSKLATNGISFLIEKPIVANLEEAFLLKRLAEEMNVLIGVGHIERYNPAFREAKRRLMQIGQVVQVSTSRFGPRPQRIQDVGVITDLLIHDLDSISWLLDETYASIFADAFMTESSNFEDAVSVSATLKSGVAISHLVNWVSATKKRQSMIFGTEGTFEVNTLTADLTFHEKSPSLSTWANLAQFAGGNEGRSTTYNIVKTEPLLLEHLAFRNAILGESFEHVSIDEGIAALRVATAALMSARDHRPVLSDEITWRKIEG